MRRNIHFLKTIGAELRNIRVSKDIQVKDMAKTVGVSSTYISEIERNMKTPSDELIEKISKTYDVELKHLFKGFGVLPEEMRQEIINEDGIFEMLYSLSFNEKITQKQKDEFYKGVTRVYNEIIEVKEN